MSTMHKLMVECLDNHELTKFKYLNFVITFEIIEIFRI